MDPLDKALADIGKGKKDKPGLRIATLGDMEPAESISTGNLTIDWLTTVGGLPKGRIIELYGLHGSGKTTLALQTSKQAMDLGLNVLFVDYEQALDPLYAKALGIDPYQKDPKKPRFLQTQPDSLEEGVNAIRAVIETGGVGMVLVDSVALMTPQKELSSATGENPFSTKAKLMYEVMRQLTPIVKRHGVVCVFLNHIQDVIDMSSTGQWLAKKGVKRTTTPGGVALKFLASMRIEFVPAGNSRSMETSELTGEREAQVTGSNVKVTVVKNKVGPPYRSGEVRVRYGRGFSNEFSALQVLTGRGIVRVTGKTKDTAPKAWTFHFEGPVAPPWSPEKYAVKGEEDALEALERHPEWSAGLIEMAREALVTVPVEEASPEGLDQVDDEELRSLLGAAE